MRIMLTTNAGSTLYDMDEITRLPDGTVRGVTRSGKEIVVPAFVSENDYMAMAINNGLLCVEDRPSAKVVTARCYCPVTESQPVQFENKRPVMQVMDAVTTQSLVDEIPIGPIKHKDALKSWFDKLAAHEKLNVYVCDAAIANLIDKGETEWEDKLTPEVIDKMKNVYRNRNSRTCILYFNAFIRFMDTDDLQRISTTYPWFDLRQVQKYDTDTKQQILAAYDSELLKY